MSIKKYAPKIIFFNEKKIRKIGIIFDIENWLWKSEIRNLQSDNSDWTLIYQSPFMVRKCYLTLKLEPFDEEVAEDFLNGI